MADYVSPEDRLAAEGSSAIHFLPKPRVRPDGGVALVSPPRPAKPRTMSAPELMALRLPPLRFVVNELLPPGYAVFAGRPKLGKSWLAYQLGLAVACGEPLFGQDTWQGEVLYLALEDGQRRAQARMQRLLDGRPPPPAMQIALDWPMLDQGGMEAIEDWAADRPGRARLCIIDTLQKVRPRSSAGRSVNAYEQDYELHGALHRLGQKLGIALISITHMRKGGGNGDWLEAVSGSTGITGAADTVLALGRDRGAADACLSITGRDVREEELALQSDNGVWSCLGAAEQVRMHDTTQRIMEALPMAGSEGLSPKAVAEVSGLNRELARKTLLRMFNRGLIASTAGKYTRRSI
jgi:hypothetical protein